MSQSSGEQLTSVVELDALILRGKMLRRVKKGRSETVDLLRDDRRREQSKRERKHDEDARLAAAAYSRLFLSALRHLRASLELQTKSVMEKQTEAHTME
jgi:hypothetical protein